MPVAQCIAIVAGAAVHVFSADTLTLSWIHSVEKVPWEEDYRTVPGGVTLEEARVRRSGAGMEPGAGATWDSGWWRYRPDLPVLPSVKLANSGFVGGYTVCSGGICMPLDRVVPGREVATIESRPCRTKP